MFKKNLTESNASTRIVLRLLCSLLIVLFGLLDLLFWRASGSVFWFYSCAMSVLVALTCMVVAGWGHEFCAKERWSRVGRQVLHWLGFIGVVYLLGSLVDMGTFTPKQAGLILLGLLGFTVYIAGLSIDLWLLLVGIVLVLLAMSVVWVHQHVWLLVIPISIAAIFSLILVGFFFKGKSKDAQ